MDFNGVERRRAICIEAASRIISENLSAFVSVTPDEARNEPNTAAAVGRLAALIYGEIGKIGN